MSRGGRCVLEMNLYNYMSGKFKKMEVRYDVVSNVNDVDIEDILVKKLVRVILNLEDFSSIALYKS